MTRKDYIVIAKAINDARRITAPENHIGIRNSADLIADAMSRDNARFDRTRFIVACGFEEGDK